MFKLIMEEAPAFVYITVFLFGICVGSFLNVCIYRIPKHESIIVVPSHCMTCNKKLKWYELIPLFSWLALRGKCSGCKSKISPQYPLIEGLNGVLWILVLFVKGISIDMILTCLLFSALVVIAIIDARTKEIPLSINIFIGVIASLRLVFYHDNLLDSGLGLVPGGVMLLILLASGGRAMGGGDVKMMLACGLFLGFKQCLFAIAVACIVGSVIHLILMKVKNLGRELAFGPYLSLGVAFASLFGAKIIEWYFGMFI